MPLSPPSRQHLFLVEDDAMVRETIRLMLEEDYEISVAVSVSSALTHMRAPETPKIDLMLLDCLLPDGRLSDVLAEADQRTIPVVLISGDPRQIEMMEPARSFLAKPFTVATLMAVLDTARR